jgi:hypothetical protein
MTELVPFFAEVELRPAVDRLPGMPPPEAFSQNLLDEFRKAVEKERTARGEITGPDDVAVMVLAVQAFRDLIGGYTRALKRVDDDAKAVHVEELLEVHEPDKDGVPQGRLWVPDDDGTVVSVKPDVDTIYNIDAGQILSVIALWLSAQWQDDPARPEPAEAPEKFAVAVTQRVMEMLGATAKIKITHARGLRDQLQAHGEEVLAEAVADAIRAGTSHKFKGVTVDRLTEDQQKRSRSRKKAS